MSGTKNRLIENTSVFINVNFGSFYSTDINSP